MAIDSTTVPLTIVSLAIMVAVVNIMMSHPDKLKNGIGIPIKILRKNPSERIFKVTIFQFFLICYFIAYAVFYLSTTAIAQDSSNTYLTILMYAINVIPLVLFLYALMYYVESPDNDIITK